MRKVLKIAAALALAAVSFSSSPAGAQSVEEFYKDKRISVLVGSSAGGGYDAYARLVTRHLGRFVPGNPSFIVQNMPGGGGMQVTNYLFNVAPKDGTAMGTIQRGLLTTPLLESRNIQVKYDARKFNWLGSLNSEVGLIVAWHTAPHRSFEDLRTKELLIGSSGPAQEFIPLFLNKVLNTKMKIISGYKSSTEAYLAMERGEVQGRVSTGWSGDREILQPWIDTQKVRMLATLATKKSPDFPNLPLITEFVQNESDRKVLELILATQALGRPFALPPEVPQDRVLAVRKAFGDMTKDQEFLAEAKKLHLDLDVVLAEEIDEILEEVYATSPDIVEQARQAIASGSTR